VGAATILSLEVRDSNGDLVESVNLLGYQPDDVYSLQNGLELQLGAGTLAPGDSFLVDVFAAVGESVDPSKPFDGIRNEHPHLQSGFNVESGAFELNGELITVSGDDSLNDILTKINTSDAGVDAEFDASTETVVMTHRVPAATRRFQLRMTRRG